MGASWLLAQRPGPWESGRRGEHHFAVHLWQMWASPLQRAQAESSSLSSCGIPKNKMVILKTKNVEIRGFILPVEIKRLPSSLFLEHVL